MSQRIFKPKHKTSSVGRTFNQNQKWKNLYNPEWESYRNKFLRVNDKCYSCGTKSEVVDHVEPHKGDEALFKKLDNHIPLCHRCHNTVTALFDKTHKPGTAPITKIQWLNSNRLMRGITFKVKVLGEYG